MRTWRTFGAPIRASRPPLIPDAYVEVATNETIRAFFVEVELATEPLRTWRRKAERYLLLARSGAFHASFDHTQFGVLVFLPSEGRLETVRRTVASATTKLFWFTTFDALASPSLTTATWWRPAGDDPVPFLS